jgi:murein L,D-transpeptidase YcbB/YkuD
MAILGADMTPEKAVELAESGKYNKVQMTKTFPVYITYFTMGQDITGRLTSFADIYQRDAPVLASFAAARQPKTGQRKSEEAIIKLDNPL